MTMRERRQRHNDIHFPMGGRGKRATPPKERLESCRHPWATFDASRKGNFCVYCGMRLDCGLPNEAES